jgi:hypothetical protein
MTDMAELDTVTQACLDKIRRDRHVSFPELARVLTAHGVDPRGDLGMETQAAPNTYIWAGMSEAFYRVVDQLDEADLIEYASVSPLAYLVDGSMLRMPLAKKPPRAGYKEPHWLPVVINPTDKAAPGPHPPQAA